MRISLFFWIPSFDFNCSNKLLFYFIKEFIFSFLSFNFFSKIWLSILSTLFCVIIWWYIEFTCSKFFSNIYIFLCKFFSSGVNCLSNNGNFSLYILASFINFIILVSFSLLFKASLFSPFFILKLILLIYKELDLYVVIELSLHIFKRKDNFCFSIFY